MFHDCSRNHGELKGTPARKRQLCNVVGIMGNAVMGDLRIIVKGGYFLAKMLLGCYAFQWVFIKYNVASRFCISCIRNGYFEIVLILIINLLMCSYILTLKGQQMVCSSAFKESPYR